MLCTLRTSRNGEWLRMQPSHAKLMWVNWGASSPAGRCLNPLASPSLLRRASPEGPEIPTPPPRHPRIPHTRAAATRAPNTAARASLPRDMDERCETTRKSGLRSGASLVRSASWPSQRGASLGGRVLSVWFTLAGGPGPLAWRRDRARRRWLTAPASSRGTATTPRAVVPKPLGPTGSGGAPFYMFALFFDLGR